MKFSRLKTTKNAMQEDELDLTLEYYATARDLVQAILETCKYYDQWLPRQIPDIVIISKDQRALFSQKELTTMVSPFNIMEIRVDGVDEAAAAGLL